MKRNLIFSIGFRLLSGFVFGFMVYVLLLFINNSLSELQALFQNQELYVCIGLTYISFECIQFIFSLFKLKRKLNDITLKKIVGVSVVALFSAWILVGVAISLYFKYGIGYSIAQVELQRFLLLYAIANILYLVLFISNTLLIRENARQLEYEETLRKKIEADFISFKAEINPDLLYESLENIIANVYHNPEFAEEQIDHLAAIYRYGLLHKHKELTNLHEEVHVSGSLLTLVKEKYSKHIHLQLDANIPEGILIIPGSLLVIIDQVVRNTLITQQKPLHFKLYYDQEDGYLIFEHTLNERLLKHKESLEAYNRLQRAYSFFSDKPFVQVKAGNEQFIKLPALQVAQD
ncbi:MAG: histidine kinase [Chryseotalea sp.]|jgi:hypothetical protein